MTHTPLTDKNSSDINNIINFLQTLVDEHVIYPEGGKKIIELFEVYIDVMTRIKPDDVKTEFWDLSNEFMDPIRLKEIYNVKFKLLLNWTANDKFNSVFITDQIKSSLLPFVERHQLNNINISIEEATKIATYFMILITALFTYKEEIESLMEQCDAFAGVDEDTRNQISEKTETLQIRIASKRKSDFIKLVSSMYDTKIFVDADGKPLTNKQKLMDAFGEFLVDDFSKYSTSLSQSKIRDEKTFMKPFKEIEKEALRYLNAVGDS